eukprot:1771526-Rhodomonas_salina.1
MNHGTFLCARVGRHEVRDKVYTASVQRVKDLVGISAAGFSSGRRLHQTLSDASTHAQVAVRRERGWTTSSGRTTMPCGGRRKPPCAAPRSSSASHLPPPDGMTYFDSDFREKASGLGGFAPEDLYQQQQTRASAPSNPYSGGSYGQQQRRPGDGYASSSRLPRHACSRRGALQSQGSVCVAQELTACRCRYSYQQQYTPGTSRDSRDSRDSR